MWLTGPQARKNKPVGTSAPLPKANLRKCLPNFGVVRIDLPSPDPTTQRSVIDHGPMVKRQLASYPKRDLLGRVTSPIAVDNRSGQQVLVQLVTLNLQLRESPNRPGSKQKAQQSSPLGRGCPISFVPVSVTHQPILPSERHSVRAVSASSVGLFATQRAASIRACVAV